MAVQFLTLAGNVLFTKLPNWIIGNIIVFCNYFQMLMIFKMIEIIRQ